MPRLGCSRCTTLTFALLLHTTHVGCRLFTFTVGLRLRWSFGLRCLHVVTLLLRLFGYIPFTLPLHVTLHVTFVTFGSYVAGRCGSHVHWFPDTFITLTLRWIPHVYTTFTFIRVVGCLRFRFQFVIPFSFAVTCCAFTRYGLPRCRYVYVALLRLHICVCVAFHDAFAFYVVYHVCVVTRCYRCTVRVVYVVCVCYVRFVVTRCSLRFVVVVCCVYLYVTFCLRWLRCYRYVVDPFAFAFVTTFRSFTLRWFDYVLVYGLRLPLHLPTHVAAFSFYVTHFVADSRFVTYVLLVGRLRRLPG